MTYREATGTEGRSREDQDGNDFIRDDDGFAINVWGHYTAAELRAKLAQLEEANCFFVPYKA